MIRKAWQIFLEILFPAICIDCGSYLPKSEAQNALCKKCFESIEVFKIKPHPHLIAVGPYGDSSLKALIHGLKFKRFTHTLPQMEALMRRYMENTNISFEQFDLITYIPLHPQRKRQRGFNQAKLIADILGEITNLKVESTLKRVKETKEQSSIKKPEERLSNVRDCFAPGNATAIRGKRIILVDDVYTSGATVNEAARTLRQAGAEEIKVFVLAKAG